MGRPVAAQISNDRGFKAWALGASSLVGYFSATRQDKPRLASMIAPNMPTGPPPTIKTGTSMAGAVVRCFSLVSPWGGSVNMTMRPFKAQGVWNELTSVKPHPFVIELIVPMLERLMNVFGVCLAQN
jgi:hypothetical protein